VPRPWGIEHRQLGPIAAIGVDEIQYAKGHISLFVQGARTDAKIARLQRDEGTRAAFETVYTESADPWASASPRYRYQGLKYDN
jgi:hypothetical protein